MDLRNTPLIVDEAFLHVLTSERQLFNLQVLVDGREGSDRWKGGVNEQNGKYTPWRGKAISKRLWLAPSALHLNPQS